MNDFLLDGWGRLNQEQMDLIKAAGLNENFGTTDDPELIQNLLDAKDLDVEPVPSKLAWG